MATARDLHRRLDALIADVGRDGERRFAAWRSEISRASFEEGAANLASYLALRRHDLRPIQRQLAALGLSSLGRIESRVLPTLLAVRRALSALAGGAVEPPITDSQFFAGEERLAAARAELLGAPGKMRPIALMITCPSEAADDPAFMRALAERRIEAVRINCAHDGPDAWQRMIDHVRTAETATGHRLRVFMDLAGPKIRTGEVRLPATDARLHRGDTLIVTPPAGLDQALPAEPHFAVECTLGEALRDARPGERLFIDDGKLEARIDRREAWGLLATVVACADKGFRLRSEKGLNFPDTHLDVPALTAKDREDIGFIAAHADGVALSFVQSAQDVVALQGLLSRQRSDWQRVAVVLKIETRAGIVRLPEIIVAAAGRQPAAVMIARGDLAVEIGFVRMAEMQEEILWLAEAAQVPVIWATQVLEHLIKKGAPVRGELTDAAMAARAECVMLNKGPYLLEAIAMLDTLIPRMNEHQHKKMSLLRPLKSWSGGGG